MKKKTSTTSKGQLHAGIAEFIKRAAQLDADRVELCKFLVTLVEQDRFALRYIQQECPKLSMPKLKLMERVGRGDFHPALLDPITPGECMLARMDYQEQVRGLGEEGTIPVETLNEDGTWTTRLLPIVALTADQVNQVSRMVNGKRAYVSTEEQRAWTLDHRTNLLTRPSRKDVSKYTIKDGNVVFLKHAVMTPAEMVKATAEAMSQIPESATAPAAPAEVVEQPVTQPPAPRRMPLKQLANSL